MKVGFEYIEETIKNLNIGKYRLLLDLNNGLIYISDRMLKDCKCLCNFEILNDTKKHKRKIINEVSKAYRCGGRKLFYQTAKKEYGEELLKRVYCLGSDNPSLLGGLYFRDCLEYLKIKENGSSFSGL